MLRYERIRKVKKPSIANKGDAGIDLYMPKLKESDIEIVEGDIKIDKNGDLFVSSMSIVVIPLGVKVDFSDHENTCLMAVDKGGNSAKGIKALAKLIDIGYTGECFFSMINLSRHSVKIEIDKPLIQVVHLPYIPAQLVEAHSVARDTERGEKCRNSSKNI